MTIHSFIQIIVKAIFAESALQKYQDPNPRDEALLEPLIQAVWLL